MKNLSNFVERLKEYMEDENLTETTLASRIGYSRITICGLLNEAHTPSTEIIIALAEYFHCSIDYLLGLTEFPNDKTFRTIAPFCERLRKCLQESKTTEYRLQQDLKLSRSLTYKWLHKNVLPSVDSLLKLKNYFGVSIDYLLGREN